MQTSNQTKPGVSEEVQAALDRLPIRQKEELLAHLNQGLSSKVIARRRGLTNRIVLRDLTRAYTTLRAKFQLDDAPIVSSSIGQGELTHIGNDDH